MLYIVGLKPFLVRSMCPFLSTRDVSISGSPMCPFLSTRDVSISGSHDVSISGS